MKESFKHIGWFFKQNKKKYIYCGISLLILSIVPVFPAKILGIAIDEIANKTIDLKHLILYSLGLFLLPFTNYLINRIYHYTINSLGHDLTYQLRDKYLSHLFDMDSSIYEEYTKGDLIARAISDLNYLNILATTFLQNLVYYIALITSSVIMMILISPKLTILSISFMPFCIFYLNKKRKKKREYYKLHSEIYAQMTESVLESIESVKVVRAYGQEENDYKKTKKAIDNDVNSWRKILRFEAMFTPMFELVYAFAYFIAISYGSYLVITNEITPGSLLTFLIYVSYLYGPLIGLSNILNNISNITIGDKRFNEIMERKSLVEDGTSDVKSLTFDKIKFVNVSFKYPFDDSPVIKDINLTINKGETIGVVGPTGSGKSTLIRQLLREFNITSGNILIDDKNIEEYKIEEVRDLVGYVPQNNILFKRSVDENILIGNPKATILDVNQAITVSDFKKDLLEMPNNLKTQVSEQGSTLSGGQKQRLSIARALVKKPEILIFDDSLSAVDALTEKNIIKELKLTRKDKTNIIIAHRFSAVQEADKIIVLQNGRITDINTHTELLKYDNWYKMQYLRQIKGDIHE